MQVRGGSIAAGRAASGAAAAGEGRLAAVAQVAGAFLVVLSAMLIIPSIRPLVQAHWPERDELVHTFVAAHLIGGILGGPLVVALVARRAGARVTLLACAVLDGLALLAAAHADTPGAMTAWRVLGGAANIGALSLVLGAGRDGARSAGRNGAAIIAAIACGSPLGTLLLKLAPALPILFAATLAALAGAIGALGLEPRSARRGAVPRGLARRLVLPMAWIGAERFVAGCVVVTLAMHARRVFGASDVEVGRLFTAFMAAFALLTYPLARIAGPRPRLVGAAGSAALAVVLAGLAWLPAAAMPLALIVAGAASAASFSAGMALVGTSAADAGARSWAMTLINVAGSIGMLAGTTCAGIISAVMRRHEAPMVSRSAAVFGLAAVMAAAAAVITVWPRRRARPGEISE